MTTGGFETGSATADDNPLDPPARFEGAGGGGGSGRSMEVIEAPEFEKVVVEVNSVWSFEVVVLMELITTGRRGGGAFPPGC